MTEAVSHTVSASVQTSHAELQQTTLRQVPAAQMFGLVFYPPTPTRTHPQIEIAGCQHQRRLE